MPIVTISSQHFHISAIRKLFQIAGRKNIAVRMGMNSNIRNIRVGKVNPSINANNGSGKRLHVCVKNTADLNSKRLHRAFDQQPLVGIFQSVLGCSMQHTLKIEKTEHVSQTYHKKVTNRLFPLKKIVK